MRHGKSANDVVMHPPKRCDISLAVNFFPCDKCPGGGERAYLLAL
jgi:hypothetical protein